MASSTDADVIRVIQQNPRLIFSALHEDPELLAEVRRAILTDELLSLPVQFAEMKAAQNEMLKTQNEILADLSETRRVQAEMLKTQNKILADLSETRTDLSETRRVQAEMLKTQNKILADLSETRTDLSETRRVQAEMLKTQNRILAELADLRREYAETRRVQNRMSGRLGNLEGADLERKLARIAPARLCQMYTFRRPQILMSEVVDSRHMEGFVDELSEANFVGVISDEQYRRITGTDMILRMRRREDGEIVYCAVEASGVIDNNDVTRAVASSDALHAVYGDKAMPVVLGYEITNDARKLAEDNSAGIIIVNRPSLS